MTDHVHDVNLRTRIGDDGKRVYEAVGPCLTCGEPIEMIPPVTQQDVEASRGVTWIIPPGTTSTPYARGTLPDG